MHPLAIEAALADALPPELRPAAGRLAGLIVASLAGPTPDQGAFERAVATDPALPLLIHRLAGRALELPGAKQTQLRFGDGAQIGELSIGDIAGGNIVKLALNFNIYYPTPPGTALPAPPADSCPYHGLTAFDEARAADFFGREQLVTRLATQLTTLPLLTIIGPSGSGKTSLVCAGIIPALRKQRLAWHTPPTLRLGPRPLGALANVLGDLGDPIAAVGALRAQQAGAQLLLYIDAFEELFSQAPPAEWPAVERVLLALLSASGCHTLLTVRAEYYHLLMTGLPNLWRSIEAALIPLASLDAGGLAQAIVGPATRVGLRVEIELVAQLVAEALGDRRDAAILPYLQETLLQLWEARRDGALTAATYVALGNPASGRSGLQQAIADRATGALARLPAAFPAVDPNLLDRLTRRIFLRLLQPGDDRISRRRQYLADLEAADDPPGLVEELLHWLSDAVLISLEREVVKRKRGKEGAQREVRLAVDLVHETLIAGWPQIGAWLSDYRDAELLRRLLEDRARHWDGASPPELVDRPELERYLAWQRDGFDHQLGLRESERKLIAAARRMIGGRGRERWLLPLAAVLAVALLAFGGQQTYRVIRREQARGLNRPIPIAASPAYTLGPAFGPRDNPFVTATVALAPFAIDAFEVRNAQYCACQEADACPDEAIYPGGLTACDAAPNLPISEVSAVQASRFCAWLSGKLPTEAEWEWAARGPAARHYPGSPAANPQALPDLRGANILQPEHAAQAVDGLPGDLTPEGVMGMTSNVSEWTRTWYLPYEDAAYGQTWPSASPASSTTLVVVRGGHAGLEADQFESVRRQRADPTQGSPRFGFRCVYPVQL